VHQVAGIQTAALSAAGQIDASPNLTGATEEYDGTILDNC
jgi:hypothetical protein